MNDPEAIMAGIKSSFDAWFHEQEGFASRSERSTVDVAWLKAAFVAGAIAERNRCAGVADEQRARCLREGDARPKSIYEWRLAASKAGEIGHSIRNPEGYLNDVESAAERAGEGSIKWASS